MHLTHKFLNKYLFKCSLLALLNAPLIFLFSYHIYVNYIQIYKYYYYFFPLFCAYRLYTDFALKKKKKKKRKIVHRQPQNDVILFHQNGVV
jgi:hypothetical protein